MTKVICIANNKGGVGKSTLTMNLSGALAEKGKKNLLIDLDAQTNLTSVFLGNQPNQTISDLIYDDIDTKNVINPQKCCKFFLFLDISLVCQKGDNSICIKISRYYRMPN